MRTKRTMMLAGLFTVASLVGTTASAHAENRPTPAPETTTDQTDPRGIQGFCVTRGDLQSWMDCMQTLIAACTRTGGTPGVVVANDDGLYGGAVTCT